MMAHTMLDAGAENCGRLIGLVVEAMTHLHLELVIQKAAEA